MSLPKEFIKAIIASAVFGFALFGTSIFYLASTEKDIHVSDEFIYMDNSWNVHMPPKHITRLHSEEILIGEDSRIFIPWNLNEESEYYEFGLKNGFNDSVESAQKCGTILTEVGCRSVEKKKKKFGPKLSHPPNFP
ncbi:hypothetical protein DdX_10931 [Ditylenchus destructor]|uniref:Uncharacterized protein n=1 Tax=Ditylenchus destructor TaxID=166010 RepID=A0AAD4N320_9BILA|nr:hypothetical protein DdX_10931 [Ditylenchus destructor]